MIMLERSPRNPLIMPDPDVEWESEATFNACPAVFEDRINLVYRAIGRSRILQNYPSTVSTIGLSESIDGVHFATHRQIIAPEFDWEKYGCEDPRITKFNDKYYIFYTALSTYPFSAQGIKVGVAVTQDFKKFEKHPVTTFNSKAMALFSDKVNGKMAALVTINTDAPPAKICIAYFDKESQIWSDTFWNNYFFSVNDFVLPLQRSPDDQVELGSQPIRTDKGWLIFYSYIKGYFSNSKEFRVEAALLDLDDPQKVLGYTKFPLLVPKKEYELYGQVPNIVFPSGAMVKGDKLYVYYGAADTTSCLATCKLNDLLDAILRPGFAQFKRIKQNPLITPNPNNPWEKKATFNPASLLIDGKTHLIYRALSDTDKSVLGYAQVRDDFTVEKLKEPVYVPRAKFEEMGCEDPRLVQIGSTRTIYMLYTAYDGKLPRVAITSIRAKDFVNKYWKWTYPVVISPEGVDDKDACIFPEHINGHYYIIHRVNNSICISKEKDLLFKNKKLDLNVLMLPRENAWDDKKIGASCPPIKTDKGWLLIYHGISSHDFVYRVGAALLDLNDPTKVISRLSYYILEPETQDELNGIVHNVVFPCGSTLRDDELTIYYGGADRVINAATISLKKLLKELVKEKTK